MTTATTTADAADRYLVDRVMTASRSELTAMLFDACAGAIRAAIRLQQAGEHVASVPRLRKGQDILMELRCTLNHEAGGQLASHLDALYTYAWQQLLQSSVEQDVAAARVALDIVEPLADAWRTACLASAA